MIAKVVTQENKLEEINVGDICSVYIFNGSRDSNKVAFAFTNEKTHLLTLSGYFPNEELYIKLIHEFISGKNFLNVYNQYLVNLDKLQSVQKVLKEDKKFKLEIIFNNNVKNELLFENNAENNKIFLQLQQAALSNQNTKNY